MRRSSHPTLSKHAVITMKETAGAERSRDRAEEVQRGESRTLGTEASGGTCLREKGSATRRGRPRDPGGGLGRKACSGSENGTIAADAQAAKGCLSQGTALSSIDAQWSPGISE